ncbi:hypothetical protein FHS31_000493 [Sphingomonas vulcanisoli]|uniref:PAS domain-containing protein n=1 Tax=Sphingomonas vulcanisoli TaxID=1658060 RepID=A0ABX0TTI3_9SPHN|nr:hypothetical protein [Sphingomonas vulcanisoli]NIJ06911.1 hypothetical protein [Sphingomonas vulcanisoli]
METPPGAAAERRLHGRAHAYWRSLLGRTRFPLIEDLDLAGVPRLAETSLLFGVDTTEGELEINLVGASIRAAWEGPESAMARLIAQVRLRLPVLTAHGKPIGFEAELAVSERGDTAYRGILLPFGRSGNTVDYVLMVVSWKERADTVRDPALLAAGLYAAEKTPGNFTQTPWEAGQRVANPLPPAPLEQKLTAARTWAALARTEAGASHERRNKASAAAYACLLDDARATPLAMVDSVFGADLPRRWRCDHAATLRYARRLCLSPALLQELLDDLGGVPEVAAMDRRVRRARSDIRSPRGDHFRLTEPVQAEDRSFSPWRGRDAEPIAVEHVMPRAQAAKD